MGLNDIDTQSEKIVIRSFHHYEFYFRYCPLMEMQGTIEGTGLGLCLVAPEIFGSFFPDRKRLYDTLCMHL